MSSAQDHASQPREESLEELHEALAAAQRRLGYFARFEALIEQQMQALSEHAAAIERETTQEQERQSQFLVELRQEAASLRNECDRRREEIVALSNHAQSEADKLIDEARQMGSAIIATTIARLRELMDEISRSAESQLPRPPSESRLTAENSGGSGVANTVSPTTTSPLAAPAAIDTSRLEEFDAAGLGARPAPSELGVASEREQPPSVPGPVDAASTGAALPAEAPDTIVTRLSVRAAPGDPKVAALRGQIVNMPGVRRVDAVSTSGDIWHLDVAHTVDSSLLGNLLAIDELDFHLIRRAESSLEIEIL